MDKSPSPPPRTITDSQFWPDARKCIENSHKADERVTLDIVCSICQESQLRFPAAVMAPDREHQGSVGVTPCGHMFCYACLREYAYHQGVDGEPEKCPLCRFEFVRACGHNIPVVDYCPVIPLADHVPLTLPEGGRIESRCGDCDYSHKINFLKGVAETLLLPTTCYCETDGPGARNNQPCWHLTLQGAFDRFSESVRETFLDSYAKGMMW